MKNPYLFVVFLAVLALVLAAGCTQTSPAPAAPAATTTAPAAAPAADTIRTTPSALGTVLVDARGMTLYFFADDIPGSGISTCYDKCAQFWPVFYVPSPAVSAPLAAADFSVIRRTDGTLQTSYKGWPLYYFSRDASAGEMKGENVQGNWSVAKPDYTVMYSEQPGIGTFLTDGSGRTLYFFARENPGEVACTGTCLDNWPAFSASPLVVPSILKIADFAGTTRPDGIRQTLYKGRLLYYFAKDAKPGDRLGEGVLNAWHVANITGYVQPELTPVPTTIPTTVPTIDEGDTSGGGGGGGRWRGILTSPLLFSIIPAFKTVLNPAENREKPSRNIPARYGATGRPVVARIRIPLCHPAVFSFRGSGQPPVVVTVRSRP